MFVELSINTPKKDRDSFNIGRIQVSGYSPCRCEGTLVNLVPRALFPPYLQSQGNVPGDEVGMHIQALV